MGLNENAAGLDLFIGDPNFLHKGLGPEIMKRFLSEIVFARAGVESCVVGPELQNATAIRAYEKAGFNYVHTVQFPNEPDPEYLMHILKPR